MSILTRAEQYESDTVVNPTPTCPATRQTEYLDVYVGLNVLDTPIDDWGVPACAYVGGSGRVFIAWK